MIEITPQPNASAIPETLLASIVDAIRSETPDLRLLEITQSDRHSNDVAQLRFSNGRTLIVKRGRYDWAAERFETARIASRLLREEAGVAAPAPLALPDGLADEPLEVYWRIDLPILEELWPGLSERQREDALREWGGMLRRAHEIRLPGYGRFPNALEESVPVTQFLSEDLEGRLLPAVRDAWPEGVTLVEALLGEIERVGTRVEGARLVHADLHLGNVLCRVEGDQVHCAGLLDLEAAFAAPPEADLANLEVSNTPLFARPLEGEWMSAVREGYGRELDPFLLSFFRIYHLANMGFWSALVGHDWHARQVAHTAFAERVRLRELRSTRSAAHA